MMHAPASALLQNAVAIHEALEGNSMFPLNDRLARLRHDRKTCSRTLLLALQLLLISVCHARDTQQHGDWLSYTLSNPEIELLDFVALTNEELSDGTSVIFVSTRYLEDCSTEYYNLNLPRKSEAEQTKSSNELPGTMRIDEFPPHDITFRLEEYEGAAGYKVPILSFDDAERLSEELDVGKTIHFVLEGPDMMLPLEFSLRGYQAAIRRTMDLCDNW